jgi:hypothetical protein
LHWGVEPHLHPRAEGPGKSTFAAHLRPDPGSGCMKVDKKYFSMVQSCMSVSLLSKEVSKMSNESPSTYDEIKALVDEGKGVTTVYAAWLRDAEGAGRLTEGINAKISRSLASRGLGHVPFKASELPTAQWSEVRVFDKTSPLGTVILAAHEVGEDADQRLREAVDSGAAGLLEQVRTLLA